MVTKNVLFHPKRCVETAWLVGCSLSCRSWSGRLQSAQRQKHKARCARLAVQRASRVRVEEIQRTLARAAPSSTIAQYCGVVKLEQEAAGASARKRTERQTLFSVSPSFLSYLITTHARLLALDNPSPGLVLRQLHLKIFSLSVIQFSCHQYRSSSEPSTTKRSYSRACALSTLSLPFCVHT